MMQRFGRAGWLAVALLAAVVLPALAADPKFPPLSGRVIDQANVLSPSTRTRLSEMLEAHEKKTTNQVVVVTLASLQGYDIADFGVRLGRAWKLGQADRNNGALLIVAPQERAVRIEVGYGLEGDLTDARSTAIIQQEILPRFRAGDLEGGIVQGTLAILGTIEGSYAPKPPPPTPWLVEHADDVVKFIMLAFIITIILVGQRYGRTSRGIGGFPIIMGGPGFGRPSGGGFSSSPRPPSFGGGGGSFGGGGASGRW